MKPVYKHKACNDVIVVPITPKWYLIIFIVNAFGKGITLLLVDKEASLGPRYKTSNTFVQIPFQSARPLRYELGTERYSIGKYITFNLFRLHDKICIELFIYLKWADIRTLLSFVVLTLTTIMFVLFVDLREFFNLICLFGATWSVSKQRLCRDFAKLSKKTSLNCTSVCTRAHAKSLT